MCIRDSGNWVQHEAYPDEKFMVDFSLLHSIDLELIECVGIPLTPEILVKAGFNRYYSENKFRIKVSVEYMPLLKRIDLYSCNEGSFRAYLINGLYDSKETTQTILNVITSVHQLQNLYFALTGEELNIEL